MCQGLLAERRKTESYSMDAFHQSNESNDAQSQTGGAGYVTDSMKAYENRPIKPEPLHHFLLNCVPDILCVFRKTFKTLTCPDFVPT